MLRIRAADAWTHARMLNAKHDDAWSESDLWFKQNNTWHQLIPPNVVVLHANSFTDGRLTSGDGFAADGTNKTLDLIGSTAISGSSIIGCNLQISSSAGSPGGTTTHEGSSHGTMGAFIVSSAAKDYRDGWGGFTVRLANTNSHSHLVSSHSHGGAVSNVPYSYNLLPVMYRSYFTSSDRILGLQTLSGLTLETLDESYLYFAKNKRATSLGGGYIAATPATQLHTHDSAAPSVTLSDAATEWTPGDNVEIRTAVAHKHNASHVPPYADLHLARVAFSLYRPSNTFYFDQLPSGSVILLTTSRVPKGYTLLDSSHYGSFVFLSNLLTPGTKVAGTNAHTHTGTASTSSPSNAAYFTGPLPGSLEWTWDIQHKHSWTDSHLGSVDHTPPYVTIILAKKD